MIRPALFRGWMCFPLVAHPRFRREARGQSSWDAQKDLAVMEDGVVSERKAPEDRNKEPETKHQVSPDLEVSTALVVFINCQGLHLFPFPPQMSLRWPEIVNKRRESQREDGFGRPSS